MSISRAFLIFLCCLALTSMSWAEWKALDSSRELSPVSMRLLRSSDQEIQVEVVLPGYLLNQMVIEGRECVELGIPGCSMLMERGCPLLPKITRLLQIPGQRAVKLALVSQDEVEVALSLPVVPSRGHFTRDLRPDSIPFEFGPAYSQNAFYPSTDEQFEVGSPFLFREVWGVRVQIVPMRVNPVSGKLRILQKAVFSLKYEEPGLSAFETKLQVAHEAKAPRAFRTLYENMFLNFRADESSAVGVTASGVPDADNKRLVVIVPQGWESALSDWVAWKRQCGFQVAVIPVPDGTTATAIKQNLQSLYDNTDSRPGYIVLIGDAVSTGNFETAQPLPTFAGKFEGAAADRIYVMLAGNDNYPDAFISRISGTTSDGVKAQLAKIMQYEQNPPTGSWLTEGVCIASDQGSPVDYERTEWLQNGGGEGQKVPVEAGGLMGYGYTSFDDIYDPDASAGKVSDAVNAGRSIICYIGHGSSTSWVSSGFSTYDVHNLSNGGMLPVIWSVACVNGNFAKTGECFAEAWLRKIGGGAAAMEAASTNESWVPPCDKQAATVNAIIRKTYSNFGPLEAAGAIRALETWGDANNTEGCKLVEQCNLFGDCTMLVRTRQPQLVTAEVLLGSDANLLCQVRGEAGNAVDTPYTITIYNRDFSLVFSTDSNGRGFVNFSLASLVSLLDEELFYTVVGPDLTPIVDQPLLR